MSEEHEIFDHQSSTSPRTTSFEPRWLTNLVLIVTTGASAFLSVVLATLSTNIDAIRISIWTSIVCCFIVLMLDSKNKVGFAFLLSVSIMPITYGLVVLYFYTKSPLTEALQQGVQKLVEVERSIVTESVNPQPALEAAIRNGAIRRATLADAQAWIDADTDKYKRRNLPSDNTYELSILTAEISKGSAYVVLKKFTYPPGLVNNHVAIFLIPRDVPMPDGNYGHSKIYYFYTEYFKGTSVEHTAGSPW